MEERRRERRSNWLMGRSSSSTRIDPGLWSSPGALSTITSLVLLCVTVCVAWLSRRRVGKEDAVEPDTDDDPCSEPETHAGELDDFSDVVKRQLQDWTMRAQQNVLVRDTERSSAVDSGVSERLNSFVTQRIGASPSARGAAGASPTAGLSLPFASSSLSSYAPGQSMMKNWIKWHAVTPMCVEPLGRLVTMKMPCNAEGSNHTVALMMERFPRATLIIDLQSDGRGYNLDGFPSLERVRLNSKSKLPPPAASVAAFLSLVRAHHRESPHALCVLHCHYGFNRTGFLACCYLVEEFGYTAAEAIAAFARARPSGIKHNHFKSELLRRYSGYREGIGGGYCGGVGGYR